MLDINTYCSHAFTSYDNRMQSVCCRAQNHAPVSKYSETFNHPDITQLRTDLINGIRNPICKVCWQDESVGITSTRQLSIRNKSLEQLQHEIDHPKLRWLWIDPGNHCNLACRTCFPDYSTTLGVEWIKKYDSKHLLQVKKSNLGVIANEDLSDIQTLMILGGEPFLDQTHFQVIDSIITQKSDVVFTIIYITNNTKKIPDTLVGYLSRFPGINMLIVPSLDAVGQPFEYIRTRGKWQEFSSNFEHLCELRSSFSNLQVAANITIGLLNCLYLDPLYTWLHDHKITEITVSFVEGADQYSFKTFTTEQKNKVIDCLGRSKHDFDFVIKSIQSTEHQPDLIDLFWKDIDWTKSYHGIDIDDYLPDLVALLRA